MREFDQSSLPMAGSLLIAHPSLLDPNFRRTVLFINSHDQEQGAFGMILNRPTGQTAVDLLPDLSLDALGGVPVYLGGPVSADHLMFAAFRWDEIDESVTCELHLSVDQASEIADRNEAEIRAFVGYAGWSAGQLEGELAQKAWIVEDAPRAILDPVHCETLWREAIGKLGPYYRLLAEAPDDPSLN